MKFTKMSLVVALLVGSSAFAIENTKVSGDANVYYQTSDARTGGTLLNAQDSSADIGINLNLTTDLMKSDALSISAGVGATVLTTLGLENTLVQNVWGSAHTATTGTNADVGFKVNDAAWINEAWVAVSAAKSIVKIGRMELDTPLAFTETWSIEKNTFEAAVLINQDIPDTTLVAAYVGNGNGTESFGTGSDTNTTINPGNLQSNVSQLGHATGGVVNGNGNFGTYGSDGAFAIAAINNSWKPLTLQAWYYDVQRIATASWLQADLNMEGILVGAQYSGIAINSTNQKVLGSGGNTAIVVDSDAMAFMLGYAMKDVATVKVSYSTIGAKHSAGQNTATDFVGGTAQSKLYTEAWWNYGKITQADTKSFNVTVEGNLAGVALGAYYTNADQTATAGNNDLSEITLTASKSVGPADVTLVYINANVKTATVGDKEDSNTVQAYITVNF